MAHVQAHILKCFTQLGDFWCEGKFTDVTIQCENQTFKCHRVALASACNYFKVMFSSQFKESTAENVTLHEISAAIFEDVLHFIYMGDIIINSTNIYPLLRASEFFELTGLEDLCLQFVKENRLTSQDTFDIFLFACTTEKTALVEILSTYITEQFGTLTSTNTFLGLSSDELKMILDRCSKSLSNEELLLGAITHWIYHSRKERVKYCEELLQMIPFKNVSPEFLRRLYSKIFVDSIGCVVYNETFKSEKLPVPKNKTSLHIFVNYDDENMTRVFSINHGINCTISAKFRQSNPSLWARSVSMENVSLYCLKYSSYTKTMPTNFKQIFTMHSTVDVSSSGFLLQPPPLILNEIGMCSLQRNVYVYNELIFNRAIRTESSHWNFPGEEINHGVYAYNCEMDNWYPVPKLKKKLGFSCMTSCNDTLYLIGGENSDETISANYAQAFDYRAGEWRELPTTRYKYSGAACCAVDNKIYVCGGTHNPQNQVERYDTIAGKWETITPMNQKMAYHCAVSFSEQLMVMGNVDESDGPANNLLVQIYKPKSNKWKNSSILMNAAKAITYPARIMEAVVFKS